MKNILVLPGWMTSIKLFNHPENFNVCIGDLKDQAVYADCVVGLSLGALIILKNIDRIHGKVILINPPLPKRSLSKWFVQWFKFITSEGLFLKRQKFTINPFKFILEIIRCAKLLKIDFSKTLDSIQKDRVVVIRGKNDRYFCDDKAVAFLNSKGIKVVEFNGGHNLSEELEKTMFGLVG